MDFELRRQARMAMHGVPERLGMSFSGGGFEMRAAPSAAGGAFEFNGYATVYSAPFPMWDQNGEPFTEIVAPGAAKRSLANPNLDVPFLIGHDDSGIPMARTRSGTMTLSEDSRGVHVHVPSMDGRREDVRALASAVERGDMSEMSLAFVCNRQQWDRDYEQRTILEMDLHRGDVCAVVHGANPATDGSWMGAAEQLAFRRPASIGGPALLRRSVEQRMPTAPYSAGADEHVLCGQCRSGNDVDAAYCDQCGTELNPLIGYVQHPDDTQVCPWCRKMNSPDAKVCDQCGRGMVNDHDGDDPGYAGGAGSWLIGSDSYGSRRPVERRAALSAADVNDLPDSDFAYIEGGGSKDSSGKTIPRSKRHFPIQDAAHVRNALARAPQSPFGPKAMPAIKAAAAKLGIGDSEQKALSRPLERRAAHAPFTGTHSHPHPAYGDQGGDATHEHEHSHDGDAAHGHSHEGRASGRPMERRSSAADDINSATAPDYDPTVSPHEPMTGTHAHQHTHADGEQLTHDHTHDNDADHTGCATSAVVEVDDSTGIPGPEQQLSAAQAARLRMRLVELEELARPAARTA